MDVRERVQNYYGRRITQNQGCCASKGETGRVGTLEVPTYGCGTPTRFADLQPEETVLDLGSGAGLDCFRAAQAVGETGYVIGVDMTPEMLKRARAGAAQLGLLNVEFREGYIEALPVEPGSVDAILSNCVVNLSTDKTAVLREAYRVLRAGGRLAISDMVRVGDAPARVTDEGWCACEDGAETVAQYQARLQEVGFAGISFTGNAPENGTYSAQIRATKPAIREASPADRQAIEALLEGADLPTDGLGATELLVLEENGTVMGVVGFEPYGEAALLRSLVVAPKGRGGGLAWALLVRALTVLRARGFTVAYVLTTTVPELLLKHGFTELSRDALPEALGASAQLRGAGACPASARAFTKQIV